MSRPPRLAERLLGRLLARRDREEILGDLAEGHRRRAERRGALGASLWYWRQTATLPSRLAWRRRAGVRLHELRYALRGLYASPGFTTVAVLSLALGIGANTALFSIMRSVLYTTLPVENPEELALVYYERPTRTGITQYGSSIGVDPVTGISAHSNYSYPIYEGLRAAVDGRAEMLGFNFAWQVAMVIGEQPATSVSGLLASGDYFSTLRLRTELGRPLSLDDDRAEAPRVAVISHALWQRSFAGDPAIIGRSASFNGVPFEIVGVTPPEFTGLSAGGHFEPTDVTFPLSVQPVVSPRWTPETGPLFASPDRFWVRIILRMPEGAAREPLREAMTSTLRANLRALAAVSEEGAEEVHVRYFPGARGLDSLRRGTRQPLMILAAVVAAVLLIACTNLASLTLARGAARQRELAVRRALGAGRWQLVRQLLLESVLLAGLGGAIGLMLAAWSGPAVTAALTASMGRVAVRFQIDWALLAIVCSVSLAAALLSGFLPALRLTRDEAHVQLSGRGELGARSALGRALIAAQIALSIPLIVAAGLFLRTLGNLGGVDPGFDTSDLVVFQVDATTVTADHDRILTIYGEILDELQRQPGVRGVTVLENVLVSGWISNTRVTIDGEQAYMHMNAVGPRYFETLGIPILAGRPILDSDSADGPPVIVVNETAQRELLDGRALGRTVVVDGRNYLVIGVAADTKYASLRDDVPATFFDSYQQRGARAVNVAVRTAVPASRLGPIIREIVARADRGLPVTSLRSQAAQIRATVSRERVFARLLTLFGAFALLIACIGLYGVTSFAVTRRRSEIGVRMALGARRDQILWLVQRQVMALTAAGLLVGLFGASLLGPVIGAMLYGLEPTDGLTLAGSAAVMLGVALLAGLLPALRAASTDAILTLTAD